MLALMQVLAREQRDELGMIQVVLPDKFDHLLQAVHRIVQIQVEAAFRFVELRIDGFQHFDKQLLLAAKVVVNHAVVRACRFRNALDAAARIALPGKHLDGGLQNLCARVLCLFRTDAGCARLAGGGWIHGRPRFILMDLVHQTAGLRAAT